MDRVALPFYGWRLSGKRPKPGYPLEINHLGDHIRRRRMGLGLTRKATAAILRTSDDSLKGWEEGRHLAMRPTQYPRIIDFLGYNPLPEPMTLGEAIRRQRLMRGWSIEKLASEAGVDPATVRRMEEYRPRLGGRSKRSVCETLSISSGRRPAG